MKKSLLIASFAAFTLVGCGGEEQVRTPSQAPLELHYSYPLHQQAAVPVTAPIVLRFNHPLTEDPDTLISNLQLQGNGDTVPLHNSRLGPDGKTLMATPAAPLTPGTEYTLTYSGASLALPGEGIQFRTAPATQGPLLFRTEGTGEFRVSRVIPDGSSRYPTTDLSVLRLQLSEPVRADTVNYGQTLWLEDAAENTVQAEVHVSGHRITIDPIEALVSGQQYQLHLTDGILSAIANAPLDDSASPIVFSAEATAPRGLLAQTTADPQQGSLLSVLSGETVNSVGLQSLLLGQDTSTQATGTVFAELGNIPHFEKQRKGIPLRISRTSMMSGSALEVLVAGSLPAGFDSGDVDIRFISDASGFLNTNPYSDRGDAPRIVELYLDLAMNTENLIANGAFAQQLLHVKLVGLATVEDGKMNIDALGVIEPDVLGVDVASGLITFRLEGYRNAIEAPKPDDFIDNTPLTIKSWVPGPDAQNKLLPGDPVVVYFNKPIAPSSVQAPGAVTLTAGGVEVPVQTELNGSVLKVRPVSVLASNVNYSLTLSNLRDSSGISLAGQTLNFNLPGTNQVNPSNQSPLVLTSLPGYPCAKTATTVTPASTTQGRCDGGRGTDDLLPLLEHPADRPVRVRFSQNMNPATLIAGNTVQVARYHEGAWQNLSADALYLEAEPRGFSLMPLEGWQAGTLYRYTLCSNGGGSCASAIQSAAGLPLQTRVISANIENRNSRTYGGPALVNHFVAGSPADTLIMPLRNLPTADTNSDLAIGAGEPAITAAMGPPYRAVANSAQLGIVSGTVNSALVTAANLGCQVGQNCPANKFIYKTAMLDVDITAAAIDGEIPVHIHPSFLYTTGVDFWVTIDETRLAICFFLCSAASLVGGKDQLIQTGPMVMRIRYSGANRNSPVPGVIFNDPVTSELRFRATLDVYLDAPYLDPNFSSLVDLNHNLRSYPLDGLQIEGPVSFLEDGRMEIALANTDDIFIDVDINGNVLGGLGDVFVGSPRTRMRLVIPQDELILNYISPITQQ
ncbi:MAG: Ig-like domain-containing protein [Marinobacter sp.]|nr:Ig-like domain-containing protein [Marinobacter sp.]